MNERMVRKTEKDATGTVVALSGDFGIVEATTAITHIEGGMAYLVPLDHGGSARIGVVHGSDGKYLRASWDDSDRNNLLDLPDLGG